MSRACDDFEDEMNEKYNLTPLRNYSKKIPQKMELKMDKKFKGNIPNKIKSLTDADININLFNLDKSIFYKGDSIDPKTDTIYEIKMDTAEFLTDPWGIKKRETVQSMISCGLSAEEYNEKITKVSKRCGEFICEKISDAFRKNNVKILTKVGDESVILEIDKDFTFKSIIADNDRNAKDLGIKRWHIIIDKK